MTRQVGPAELAMPKLWQAVDQASTENQALFFRLKIVELGGLSLAAAATLAPASWAGGVGPAVSLVAFIIVLLLHVSRVGAKAESRWYDARAAAESIKSSTWQYAVGGEAFRLDDQAAKERFVARLKDMLGTVPKLDIGAWPGATGCVTAGMESVRRSSREERAAIYRRLRIDDQVRWYSRKAAENRARSRTFNGITIAVELVAIVVGVLRFKNETDVDFLSVLAALSAGLIAWTQAKKYTLLSESYSVTSHEVDIVAGTMVGNIPEERWAQSVHDAEAAFSREHTMWQARRQGPR